MNISAHVKKIAAALWAVVFCALLVVPTAEAHARTAGPGEYFYNQLDAAGQEVYDALLAQMQAEPERMMNGTAPDFSVTVTSTIQSNSMYGVLHAFTRDHPEFYWIDASKLAWNQGTPEDPTAPIMSLDTTVRNESFIYTGIDEAGLPTQYQQFQDQVNAIIASAPADPLQKLEYFDDWLSLNNAYNVNGMGSENISRSAVSGILSNNNANIGPVCYGYATALKVLMDKAGIENIYIEGIAYNDQNLPNGEQHAWNVVLYDGQYYAIDPTWNDSGVTSRPSTQTYFMVGTNTVTVTRPDMATQYGTFGQNHPTPSSAAGGLSYTGFTMAAERLPITTENIDVILPDGTRQSVATFDEAITLAQNNSGSTILLWDAIQLTGAVEVPNNTTIDLNSVGADALTSASGGVLTIPAGATVTITNSGLTQASKIAAAAGSGAAIQNNGQLILGPGVTVQSGTTAAAVSGTAPVAGTHGFLNPTLLTNRTLTCFEVVDPTTQGGTFSQTLTVNAGATLAEVNAVIDALTPPALQYILIGTGAIDPMGVPANEWVLFSTPAGEVGSSPLPDTTALATGDYVYHLRPQGSTGTDYYGYTVTYTVSVTVDSSSTLVPRTQYQGVWYSIVDEGNGEVVLTIHNNSNATRVNTPIDNVPAGGDVTSTYGWPWQAEQYRDMITSIHIEYLEGANHTIDATPDNPNASTVGTYTNDLTGFFAGMTAVESVTGLANIRGVDNAMDMFYGCSSLKSITLPTNFMNTKIFRHTFQDCTSLESVTFEGYAGAYATECFSMFSGCSNLKAVNFADNSTFGSWIQYAGNMFNLGPNSTGGLTEIVFPSSFSGGSSGGILEMQNMFANNPNLETVIFPENARVAADCMTRGMFTGDTKVNHVAFPGGMAGLILTDNTTNPSIDLTCETLDANMTGVTGGWVKGTADGPNWNGTDRLDLAGLDALAAADLSGHWYRMPARIESISVSGLATPVVGGTLDTVVNLDSYVVSETYTNSNTSQTLNPSASISWTENGTAVADPASMVVRAGNTYQAVITVPFLNQVVAGDYTQITLTGTEGASQVVTSQTGENAIITVTFPVVAVQPLGATTTIDYEAETLTIEPSPAGVTGITVSFNGAAVNADSTGAYVVSLTNVISNTAAVSASVSVTENAEPNISYSDYNGAVTIPARPPFTETLYVVDEAPAAQDATSGATTGVDSTAGNQATTADSGVATANVASDAFAVAPASNAVAPAAQGASARAAVLTVAAPAAETADTTTAAAPNSTLRTIAGFDPAKSYQMLVNGAWQAIQLAADGTYTAAPGSYEFRAAASNAGSVFASQTYAIEVPALATVPVPEQPVQENPAVTPQTSDSTSVLPFVVAALVAAYMGVVAARKRRA